MKLKSLWPVAQPRLVRLLPCPFCGSEAEITDESQPDRPESWFFGWCKNRTDCNSWLAAESPEAVASKWNRRTSRDPQAIDALSGRLVGFDCREKTLTFAMREMPSTGTLGETGLIYLPNAGALAPATLDSDNPNDVMAG